MPLACVTVHVSPCMSHVYSGIDLCYMPKACPYIGLQTHRDNKIMSGKHLFARHNFMVPMRGVGLLHEGLLAVDDVDAVRQGFYRRVDADTL